MQLIAGLSKTLYWFGNLIFDLLYSFIILLASCLVILIFDHNQILTPNLTSLLFAFTLTSLNCLLVTYFIINLNFRKELTEIFIKYSLLITGVTLGFIDLFYYFLNAPKITELTSPFVNERSNFAYSFYFKILSPVYNILDTIFQFLNLYWKEHCLARLKKEECDLIDSRDYHFENNLAAYLISCAIFGLLIFLVNFYSHLALKLIEGVKISMFRIDHENLVSSPEQARKEVDLKYLANIKDPNVDRENELSKLLTETNSLQNNVLVVYDLYKLFGGLEAVNHLSFTVKREECFGLLGINGAGKTTTFRMIGGALTPTSGQINLDGYSFETNPFEYYRKLGYCPQENTHTKRITVIDNLKFYARINGVPSSLINATVKALIEECDLQEQQNKFSEKLSGGNMRKLSTAIALIGKKDLILLGGHFFYLLLKTNFHLF